VLKEMIWQEGITRAYGIALSHALGTLVGDEF